MVTVDMQSDAGIKIWTCVFFPLIIANSSVPTGCLTVQFSSDTNYPGSAQGLVPHDYVCVSGSVMSNSLWPQGLSPPDSPVHGILLARILEWVAICFSRRLSWLPHVISLSLSLFFYLAVPLNWRNLSSQTRDGTLAPCSGSTES